METFVTGRIQPVQWTLRTERLSQLAQNTILALRSHLMEKYPRQKLKIQGTADDTAALCLPAYSSQRAGRVSKSGR